MPVVADMIDVHDESASCVCVYVCAVTVRTVCVIVRMHLFAYMSAAGRLHIRHSQQHDAGGGAHPVDGAE